ncbi:30S ribosomal protein S6 [Candidatus Tremblaya phenacola]|uniref:Small ribosomal subunit protein bS6 n=1 Tax=Candidatus Tremblayella phenacoccinincola TaxID=1010676 RepID=A0A2G0V710_9PROT|nr:30S ribosomal protein S6 [Candidatus Tremblaya phenacola]PHN16250.1 30S ribosomal protein S6 [Candidatus Tremblaya phenacola]
MNHYEIVYLMDAVNNKESASFFRELSGTVLSVGGLVHRYESWGKHILSYVIKNTPTAYYYCMNIECSCDSLIKINTKLKQNRTLLRFLIVKRKYKPTCKSVFIKALEKDNPSQDQKE